MTTRVTFSDVQKVHEIPVDKMNVIARSKFTYRKFTKYDPHNCDICKISCNSKIIYDTHVMGKKHSKALEKLEASKFPCEICSLTLNKLDSWQNHLNSVEHQNTQLINFTICTGIPISFGRNKINYCDVCELDCGSNIILQSHLTGAKHKRKLKLMKIEKLIESKDSTVYCEICGLLLEPELMVLHKKSGKHKKPKLKDKLNSKSKGSMEFCALCHKDLSEFTEAIEHYKSTDHLDNVKKIENIFWCEVCKIILPNELVMNTHLKVFLLEYVFFIQCEFVIVLLKCVICVDFLCFNFTGFKHYRILNRKEFSFEGTYKEKLLLKQQKEKELRAQFEKEKSQLENID